MNLTLCERVGLHRHVPAVWRSFPLQLSCNRLAIMRDILKGNLVTTHVPSLRLAVIDFRLSSISFCFTYVLTHDCTRRTNNLLRLFCLLSFTRHYAHSALLLHALPCTLSIANCCNLDGSSARPLFVIFTVYLYVRVPSLYLYSSSKVFSFALRLGFRIQISVSLCLKFVRVILYVPFHIISSIGAAAACGSTRRT